MACRCQTKVMYCLQQAQIPTDIFSSVVCPTHKPDGRQAAPYIACCLQPDTAVSGSENLESWPISYHGTTVEVVRSILVHGQLLMAGDILCNGIQIGRRCGEEQWDPAIYTNPDRAGAEMAAETARYDNDETQFKVIVRLRQKPGTYSESKLGYGGNDLWSTNRRGTLYIEALEVRVGRSKGAIEPPAQMPLTSMTYITSFMCPVQREAFEVLQLLNIPQSVFNSKYNRCYCATCYPDGWKKSMIVAGETYAIPRGWTRFGLAVNPVFAHINDIWNSWPIAFHGCHPTNITSIIKNRTLLKPYDVLCDGKEIPPNFQNFKEKSYFLSPEVGYASHMWYAKPIKFKTSAGRVKYFQTIFSFKVRPQVVERKRETEGGRTRLYDDYSIIKENEMEWYSPRRGCTHPYGLLIRTIDVDNIAALCSFFTLPPDWTKQDDPLSFC